MQEMIQIQNSEITVKEYKGKRVVTFKDIDTVHQRPEGTAHRNFKTNRQRFISGVDFFKVCADEIRLHKIIPDLSNKVHEDIILITESGYLMLVKSFTDDLAWRVQRDLVDTYFRVKEYTAEQTVTVTESVPVEDIEMYLEAARIMASVPNSQRYVINCLRHVVSDIGDIETKETVTEVITSVPTLPDKQKKKKYPRYIKEGVDVDINKLLLEICNRGMSISVLANKANVSVTSVSGWIAGKHRPVLQNRINLCSALGKDSDFLTP